MSFVSGGLDGCRSWNKQHVFFYFFEMDKQHPICCFFLYESGPCIHPCHVLVVGGLSADWKYIIVYDD